MIWPFIYEALLPRLLTLTLCRQVTMIIIKSMDGISQHWMPEETGGTAEEKSSPHPDDGINMHITCLLEHDHLT